MSKEKLKNLIELVLEKDMEERLKEPWFCSFGSFAITYM